MPEVLGDAALYADPFDSGDIAEKIGAVLADDGLRRTLELKGLKRAAAFSWRKAAEQTFAFWQKVIGENGG